MNYLTELKEEELKDLSFKDPQSMMQNPESFSAIMDKIERKVQVTGADMNRFMKKFKAVYCNASFIFAIAVLMVTISLCIFYPDSVNASQSPSPSVISVQMM